MIKDLDDISILDPESYLEKTMLGINKTVRNGGYFLWNALIIALWCLLLSHIQNAMTLSGIELSFLFLAGVATIVLILMSFLYWMILKAQRNDYSKLISKFYDLDDALNYYRIGTEQKSLKTVLTTMASAENNPDRLLALENALNQFKGYYWSKKELL